MLLRTREAVPVVLSLHPQPRVGTLLGQSALALISNLETSRLVSILDAVTRHWKDQDGVHNLSSLAYKAKVQFLQNEAILAETGRPYVSAADPTFLGVHSWETIPYRAFGFDDSRA